MGAGNGKSNRVSFDLEYQAQFQTNAHFKVVFYKFADAQPGMLMRMTQGFLQSIDGLADFNA